MMIVCLSVCLNDAIVCFNVCLKNAIVCLNDDSVFECVFQ